MSNETVPRWQVEADRLTDHMKQDRERFARLDDRLQRIETDVRSLLQWRWQLTGVVAAVVFLATLLAGWMR